ncbi:hypothetical protein [Chthoniobacter flavus]|uniref:hypothetical protein n=1 Tax=Chthoniobacter flavus TaxID=191863 RepID=UPI001A9F3DCE|nr:hypothetical protein [Chthoniobacter flavus]
MNDTQPAVWVVSGLGALIPLVLLGGTYIAAWRRLARTYPASPVDRENMFYGVSGHIGGTYGAVGCCIRVGLSCEGLRISMGPQFLLPAIMVPWSDITSCERARYYFSPVGIRIAIARWPEPIHFWSRLWRHEGLPQQIQTLWHEHAPKVA